MTPRAAPHRVSPADAGASGGASVTARESGNAVVEFLAVTLVVLVPLVYLVLLLARVQAASYAVSVAAREAARVYVSGPANGQPLARAEAAARLAFEDHGFATPGNLQVECSAQPCLTPDATVRVHVRYEVALPLVPDVVADALPLAVPVEAGFVAAVEGFGG